MNKLLLAFAAIALAPRVFSQTQYPTPRLAGMINLPDMKRAVLEIQNSGWHRGQPMGLMLAESEREGDILVRAIHTDNGSVELGVGHSNILLSLAAVPNQGGGATAGLVFENANLGTVLPIYQELIARTLLRHPSLPSSSISLRLSATNRSEAAAQLVNALSKEGITIIPDGDKFMMVVPKSLASAAKPHSSEIKSVSRSPAAPANSQNPPKDEMIPAGTINFYGVDPAQVAQIYAMLVGRRLDRSQSFPRVQNCDDGIFFKSKTPLTSDEAAYAFETELLWSGVKFVPEGDKLLRAVPAD